MLCRVKKAFMDEYSFVAGNGVRSPSTGQLNSYNGTGMTKYTEGKLLLQRHPNLFQPLNTLAITSGTRSEQRFNQVSHQIKVEQLNERAELDASRALRPGQRLDMRQSFRLLPSGAIDVQLIQPVDGQRTQLFP